MKGDSDMEYPVYEKGKQIAVLSVREDGLYTRFSAVLPPSQALSRLWLIGEDRNLCLGILEPKKNGRYIQRLLSREQMRKLPQNIKYALCTGSKAVFTLRRPQTNEQVQSIPQASSNSSLNWKASSMGCYTARDSLSALIAIPTSIQGEDGRLRFVNIKGSRYMVFRY